MPDQVRNSFLVREHLKDGKLTLFFEALAGKIKVGDVFLLKIGLVDPGMPETVETTEVALTIGDVAIVGDKEDHQRKERKGGEDGDKPGKGKDAPTHGIPPCVLLTRDGRPIQGHDTEHWPSDFTDADGGMIEDLGEGKIVYKVNYDNVYHLKYRVSQHGDIARDVVTEKFILGMRITLMGYEHAYRSLKKARGVDSSGLDEFADDFRRMAARGAASTVLALAENLPKIVDASSVQSEAE